MSAAPPPILTATAIAYRDCGRALRAMPNLALMAFAVPLVVSVFNVLVVYRVVPATSLLGRDIMGLVSIFLLVPFYIAVHRFIILDEVTPRYVLDPRDVRFQLFIGWLAVISILSNLVGALSSSIGGRYPVLQIVAIIAAIAMCVASLRLTVLYPAIAVDAPGATWRNAVRDTKGHALYIFFLLLTPMVPVFAAMVAVMLVKVLRPSVAMSLLALVLVSFGVMVMSTVLIAVASRLYLNLGDRVARPPGE